MPSIGKDFLLRLQDDYKNYNTFIETGTHTGNTIFSMEPHFEKLYTIELSKKYYVNTSEQYSGNKIIFFHGDSTEFLNVLCPEIKENAIFFLDAHFSNGDTAQGKLDCPLLSEIQAINDFFKEYAIIIIDDFRLFGTHLNENWSDIYKSSIENILGKRIYKSYHLPSELSPIDRWVIHICK